MTIIPGINCAEALVSLDLPFATIVTSLMTELDLTRAEAAMAAVAACNRLPDTDRGHRVDA